MDYRNKMKLIIDYEDWKQYEIANKLNISSSAFSQFKNQKRIIPIEILNKFCNLYNVSLDYFFDFTQTERYETSKKDISFNEFVERFNKLRRIKNISQKGIEIKTGIPRTTIENYETKITDISTKSLYLICQKYHISADYLLGKIDSPKYLK